MRENEGKCIFGQREFTEDNRFAFSMKLRSSTICLALVRYAQCERALRSIIVKPRGTICPRRV